MARSRPSALILLGALALVAGCNTILGLSDYEDGECSGAKVCADAGEELDASEEDSAPPPPPVDASGTGPVRWAKFKMPNYEQDGGPPDNPQKYTPQQGAVFDEVSKRTWREPILERGAKTWAEANEICANASTSEQKWRLPSRIELVTLLHLEQPGPKIEMKSFPSTEAAEYWTLSEVRPYGDGAPRRRWTVDFQRGGLNRLSEDSGRAGVRCILDGR